MEKDLSSFWNENDDLAAAFKLDSGFLILDRRENGVTFCFCGSEWILDENDLITEPDGTLFDIAQNLSDMRGYQLKGRISYHEAIKNFLDTNCKESLEEWLQNQ